jgi:manganese/zinc/iron transport system permease protein
MEIFLDPLYRGPFIGTLLMSFSMALIGALMFVRKQSLIGETVSHATFPGVACGALVASCLDPTSDAVLFWAIMIGALALGILGYFIVEKITLASKKSDVSLCYTLASFFGGGVLIASYMQQTSPLLYKKIQVFFYGQVATMTDWHIAVYGLLSFLILGCVFFLFRALTYSCFDPLFSKSVGINLKKMNNILLLLLVLAIVIGIRSVGIVLISGMLIAPSVAARVWTQRFSTFMLLSSGLGVVSALFGSYVSLQEIPFAQGRYVPPGPAIVVIASLIAFSSLLFSPSKGLCAQMFRKHSFQKRCLEENILKCLWRANQKELLFSTLLKKKFSTKALVWFAIHRLYREGFVRKNRNHISLTTEGIKKAAYIVRLHRLWELYLMEFLTTGIENVHRSAEEIEHFITPELEAKLTKILSNPNQDPHQQPIPPKELL